MCMCAVLLLQELLSLVLSGASSSLSGAKRYRLRCLQPLVLLLSAPSCPQLDWVALLDEGEEGKGGPEGGAGAAAGPGSKPPGAEDGMDDGEESGKGKGKGKAKAKAVAAVAAAAKKKEAAVASGEGGAATASSALQLRQAADDGRRQLVGLMLGEIVLAVKEANTKTRAAAYQLLVELGRALQGEGGRDGGDDEEMGGGGEDRGLRHFFNMVMAGSCSHAGACVGGWGGYVCVGGAGLYLAGFGGIRVAGFFLLRFGQLLNNRHPSRHPPLLSCPRVHLFTPAFTFFTHVHHHSQPAAAPALLVLLCRSGGHAS